MRQLRIQKKKFMRLVNNPINEYICDISLVVLGFLLTSEKKSQKTMNITDDQKNRNNVLNFL